VVAGDRGVAMQEEIGEQGLKALGVDARYGLVSADEVKITQQVDV
jgi:hypothetical protein